MVFTQREQHYRDDANSPEIVKVEYTDGFGRLLQTRTQAEDVIFGDQTFGSSGLPASQSDPNGDAAGRERSATSALNVVVSGWKVHNNKGKVVEQYEPFFDKGFTYQGKKDSKLGRKVRQYYDPRQQVVRTVTPDDSEEWVVFGRPATLTSVGLSSQGLPEPDVSVGQKTFTPWETYNYDANDLAGETHPQNSSNTNSAHHHTPTHNVLDAMGRTIRTIQELGAGDTVEMQYDYDIRGNRTRAIDALGRIAFRHVYDLKPPKKNEEDSGANVLWTEHIDSGITTSVYDAAFKPVEVKDAKGARTLHTYDEQNRPLKVWAKDYTDENIDLREKLIYGDSGNGPANAQTTNHLGQLYQHYDEAGKALSKLMTSRATCCKKSAR
jgi:hypothetical protein